MKYRPIFDGAEFLSILGIGGNIFGYACDEKETHNILCAARDVGINLVDTADVYSNGQSEVMIGNSLVGQREKWIIASKVGVKSNETGNGRGSKKLIYQRLEDSLRRLRTDYVDIYQLHHWDPITPIEETIDAMDTLCSSGKVRFYGLSNLNQHQVSIFVEKAKYSNRTLPATVQLGHNILKRERVSRYVKCQKEEWPQLLVYGVLGRGVLTGKYRMGESISEYMRASRSIAVKGDLQPQVFEVVDKLSKIASSARLTMPQLALAYAIRCPEVSSAIIGIRSIEQLEELSKNIGENVSSSFWSTIDSYLSNLDDLKSISLGA